MCPSSNVITLAYFNTVSSNKLSFGLLLHPDKVPVAIVVANDNAMIFFAFIFI